MLGELLYSWFTALELSRTMVGNKPLLNANDMHKHNSSCSRHKHGFKFL
jgi:hypothetical protein